MRARTRATFVAIDRANGVRVGRWTSSSPSPGSALRANFGGESCWALPPFVLAKEMRPLVRSGVRTRGGVDPRLAALATATFDAMSERFTSLGLTLPSLTGASMTGLALAPGCTACPPANPPMRAIERTATAPFLNLLGFSFTWRTIAARCQRRVALVDHGEARGWEAKHACARTSRT